MKIETKFNVGDTVYAIAHFSEEKFITCPTCNGLLKITINGKTFTCPDCYGHGGEKIWLPKKWDIYNEEGMLAGYNHVNKIDIDINKKGMEIRYILGTKYSKSESGTLWLEEDLFFSKEKALKECEKRNLELEKSA
jgi:predicted RNA-binding Zn-ribbon protein involved in translation (DUF1610 family)